MKLKISKKNKNALQTELKQAKKNRKQAKKQRQQVAGIVAATFVIAGGIYLYNRFRGRQEQK